MKLKYIDINGHGVLVDKSVEIKEDSLFIDLETKDLHRTIGRMGGFLFGDVKTYSYHCKK